MISFLSFKACWVYEVSIGIVHISCDWFMENHKEQGEYGIEGILQKKRKKGNTLVKTTSTFPYFNIRIYSHKRVFQVQYKGIIMLENETNKYFCSECCWSFNLKLRNNR